MRISDWSSDVCSSDLPQGQDRASSAAARRARGGRGLCARQRPVPRLDPRAMGPILNVVFPIFAIMAAGYSAGHFAILGKESSEALNRCVYFLALPAVFFVPMARVTMEEVSNLPFLGAYGGGAAATFEAGRASGRGREVEKA